jgi:hypothetical protein
VGVHKAGNIHGYDCDYSNRGKHNDFGGEGRYNITVGCEHTPIYSVRAIHTIIRYEHYRGGCVWSLNGYNQRTRGLYITGTGNRLLNLVIISAGGSGVVVAGPYTNLSDIQVGNCTGTGILVGNEKCIINNVEVGGRYGLCGIGLKISATATGTILNTFSVSGNTINVQDLAADTIIGIGTG